MTFGFEDFAPGRKLARRHGSRVKLRASRSENHSGIIS
jgi:hypothetical protein